MAQEEKQLLLKDLCAKLPYGVKVRCEWNLFQGDRCSESGELVSINIYADSIHFKRNSGIITEIPFNRIDGTVLPYLRPMSNMTEEEGNELLQLMGRGTDIERIDFYLSHHFDYRGLIPKGLALEATEGMYKN